MPGVRVAMTRVARQAEIRRLKFKPKILDHEEIEAWHCGGCGKMVKEFRLVVTGRCMSCLLEMTEEMKEMKVRYQ